MSHRAAVVIQIVRTFGVGVIRTAVDGKISAVVNRELILIEVLVLGEIWPAIELDPGRFRLPAIPHDEMPDAREVTVARQLLFTAQSGIPWSDLRVVNRN